MATHSKSVNVGILILITIIGFLLGAVVTVLVNWLLSIASPEGGSVLGIFTDHVGIGLGAENPIKLVNIDALKIQFGFQLNINLMSILGIWIAHKVYRSKR